MHPLLITGGTFVPRELAGTLGTLTAELRGRGAAVRSTRRALAA